MKKLIVLLVLFSCGKHKVDPLIGGWNGTLVYSNCTWGNGKDIDIPYMASYQFQIQFFSSGGGSWGSQPFNSFTDSNGVLNFDGLTSSCPYHYQIIGNTLIITKAVTCGQDQCTATYTLTKVI